MAPPHLSSSSGLEVPEVVKFQGEGLSPLSLANLLVVCNTSARIFFSYQVRADLFFTTIILFSRPGLGVAKPNQTNLGNADYYSQSVVVSLARSRNSSRYNKRRYFFEAKD